MDTGMGHTETTVLRTMATSPAMTPLGTLRSLSQHPCPQVLLAQGLWYRDILGRVVLSPQIHLWPHHGDMSPRNTQHCGHGM